MRKLRVRESFYLTRRAFLRLIKDIRGWLGLSKRTRTASGPWLTYSRVGTWQVRETTLMVDESRAERAREEKAWENSSEGQDTIAIRIVGGEALVLGGSHCCREFSTLW